jgi:hypothetical protein
MAEMEALIAMVGMNTKLLNFPTAPTAADALTPPIILTMAVRNRNEMLVTPF